MRTQSLFLGLALVLARSCKNESSSSLPEYQGEETYSVILGETVVGHLKATTQGDTIDIDYDYKNNGRGPTMVERIVLNPDGYPVKWDISGNTTFGNAIEEHFSLEGQNASWSDATGRGSATVEGPQLYVNQFGSPYSTVLAARILLGSPEMAQGVLPMGTLTLTEMESLSIPRAQGEGELDLTTYALSGAGLNPSYFILDDQGRFFATIAPSFVIIREGYEAVEKDMRQLAENYSTKRYEDLQSQYAHKYEKRVRIQNVRVFDSKNMELTEPVSVVVERERISALEAVDATEDNEVLIEGNGGTLIPGLYEMHAHTGDNAALLNVLAGVTSFRDMGNNNEVLDDLVEKIE